MATSFTGSINTYNNYQKASELTGVTFTSGKTYTMQVQNAAYFKVDDAEFLFSNREFQYKAGSSELYIKTTTMPCVLSILEEA